MEMSSNRPQKPRLLLNFIFALIVIAFAFSLDKYHKHLQEEQKAATGMTADTTARSGLPDTGAQKNDSLPVIDTSDTAAVGRKK
jgi:hypothetical protein